MSEEKNINRSHIKSLFIPFITFCIRRGIKLQEFVEISKEVFVEVARRELELANVEPNSNRLSLASGVHRKDVDRIRSGLGGKKTSVDLIARVIGQWKNDKRFCKKAGVPKSLKTSGKEGEFAELVYSVSRELNPYSVLSELERLNFIRRENELVHLIKNEFTPKKDFGVGIDILSKDIADLITSVEQNSSEGTEIPALHLTTRYDNVPPEYLPMIRKWLMVEGEKLHHKARNFLSKYDKDLNPSLWKKEGGCKVSIGTFGNTEEK